MTVWIFHAIFLSERPRVGCISTDRPLSFFRSHIQLLLGRAGFAVLFHLRQIFATCKNDVQIYMLICIIRMIIISVIGADCRQITVITWNYFKLNLFHYIVAKGNSNFNSIQLLIISKFYFHITVITTAVSGILRRPSREGLHSLLNVSLEPPTRASRAHHEGLHSHLRSPYPPKPCPQGISIKLFYFITIQSI